eukprot:6179380-Amphidinium_carterae.1
MICIRIRLVRASEWDVLSTMASGGGAFATGATKPAAPMLLARPFAGANPGARVPTVSPKPPPPSC